MTEPPDLWAEARERLPDDVQEWLSGLDGAQQSSTDAQWIDSLISEAQKKQEELEKNRHGFALKAGKHKLELRPLFENMIKWIDKFKGIGDVVSSFDPVHAALPWAAFRFVLQHLVAEQEHSDKFVKLLASMPRLLFTGRIFELVYTKKSMHLEDTQDEIHMGLRSLENLHRELVDLYAVVLSALQFCHSFFTKNKAMRKVAAIFNSSKPGEILGQLEEQHKKVVDCGDDCKKISSHRLERKLLRLLQDHQISTAQMNDQVSRILVHIDERQRQETLGRISSIPFQTHHDDVSHRRTPGTCDWITGREEFHRWTGGSYPVIVLYGIPGAGKTYLTSKVIDTVLASINESANCNEAVAFFYCKRDEENRRKPRDILQSILRQLSSDILSDKCKIHPRLRGLPDELERKGKTFDLFTCKDLIREIIEDYSRTSIILDALDECDRESREELMTAFDELIQGNANIRIFLSSRTDDDIRRHFQSRPVIEIQTTDNEDDISHFVEDKLSRDRRWDNLEPRLRREIKQVFREKSQGMFQWAALQIQQLSRLSVWSKSNISEHLEIAPKGLEAAYDVVWEQIQDMPRGQACMAQRAFLWVLCAFEPLHTAELSLAMQLDPNSNESRPQNTLDIENILDVCGNLLTYIRDEKQHLEFWHFCHLSAREYIENKHHYDMRTAHHQVAISSFKFLVGNTSWRLLSLSSSRIWNRLTIRFEPNARLVIPCHYILRQALNHARVVDSPRAIDTELSSLVKQFLGSIEIGSSTFRKWKKMYEASCVSPLEWTRPLDAMAAFGLFYMLRDWWQMVIKNPEIHRSNSPSILSLAIKHGHEVTWRFLIKSNEAINVGYPPPLITAIEVNSVPAFEALIDAGANVNREDISPSRNHPPFKRVLGIDTPLKAAISAASYDFRRGWSNNRALWYPHPGFNGKNEGYKLVNKLLDKQALVDMQTEHGSALETAVKHLTTEDAIILLDKLESIPKPDRLFCLAAGNETADLDYFIERLGVDIDCRWEGKSPLMHAVHANNTRGVRKLLALGARFELASKNDQKAVFRSAHFDGFRGQEVVCTCAALYDWHGPKTEMLDLLLASDVDINANDGESDLLSTFIRFCDHYSIIERLVNAGADVNQILPRSPFVTALSLAAARLNSRAFLILLDAGADPALNTNTGVGTALASAAFHGNLDICRMLLDDIEVDVNKEQGGFFPNALFALIAGRTKDLTTSRQESQHSRPEDLLLGAHLSDPRHLEVLELFFENGLHLYSPLYNTLGSRSSLQIIDMAGYKVTETFLCCGGGHVAYLPDVWFSIAYELQNGPRPQIPIRNSLQEWNYPKPLPPRFSLVAKFTPVLRGLFTLFIFLCVDQALSEIHIVPARRWKRRHLTRQPKETRWRCYVPRDESIVVDGLQSQAQVHSVDLAWASCFRNDQLRVVIYVSAIAGIFAMFLWYLSHLA